jgi:hypothetical protein
VRDVIRNGGDYTVLVPGSVKVKWNTVEHEWHEFARICTN